MTTKFKNDFNQKTMTQINLQDETSLSTFLTNEKAIELIKAELQKTVEFSKSLEIKDYNNDNQFKVVKDARQGYVKTRNTIKRAFKQKRDEYNKLSKENLEAEREVIGVIQEEEDRLDEMVKEANRLKLVEENKLKLQSRKEQLLEYDCDLSDDELLEMKDQSFFAKLSEAKEIYLEEKERKLKEQEEKLKREKELKDAAEKARKEAEAKAKKEKEEAMKKAEQAKKEAIEEERRKAKEAKERAEKEKQDALKKAEDEKQKIIKEQEEKEQARIAEEKRKADEAKAQEEQERKEAEKLAKKKKYQKWLYDNNFNEDSYILHNDSEKIIMYKKVSEFIL